MAYVMDQYGDDYQTIADDFMDDMVLLYVLLALFAVGCVGFLVTLLGPPRRKVPLLTEDDRAVLEASTKLDGAALHHKVDMERWCVTPDDLRQFRRLVENHIAEGKIQPTDLDRFDPKDNEIGPCVHTVNTQLIMPVTKAAGGPSWALMKHPEGLPCDVFVTHGWAEGIYEFIDKVLLSWPRGAQGAYCCMLSNPQNLDISGMISSPSDSPFAKALRAASYMMVVPNSKGSIYTRVWCAYEAYLGYSGDKNIFTAKSPSANFWFRVLQNLFALIWGSGTAGLIEVGLHYAGLAVEVAHSIALGIGFVFVFLWYFKARMRNALKLPALFCIGAFATAAGFLLPPLARPGTIPTMAFTAAVIPILAYTFEADTAMLNAAAIESSELEKDFTGKLRDAKCSVPSDGERIRAELAQSGAENEIDGAVTLLIHMGTFSRRLRNVVQKTGVLGNVSIYCRSFLTIALIMWMSQFLEHFTFNRCQAIWVPYSCIATEAVYVFILLMQPKDYFSFAVNCLQTFYAVIIVTAVVLLLDEQDKCIIEGSMAFFAGPLAILLAALGPANVARVPVVGRRLVRMLLMPRKKKFAESSEPVGNI